MKSELMALFGDQLRWFTTLETGSSAFVYFTSV